MTRIFYFLVFFSIASTIVTLVHYYFIIRLLRDTGIGSLWRRVLKAIIIALLISLPVTMLAGRSLPFAYSRYLVWFPYVWMGTMVLLLTALLGADLLRLLNALLGKLAGRGAPDPQRRLFLARAIGVAAVSTVTGAATAAVRQGTKAPVVHRVEVPLEKLSPSLNGFSIAQITDLHVGLTLGREWVADVVRRTNALRPDLIAITGDLMDGSPHRLLHELEPLGELAAPKGIFFVTGNHEYYSGVTEWLPELRRLGMRVLRNESLVVQKAGAGFRLAGVDDHDGGRITPGHGPDLLKALRGRDPREEVVLLAHQPRAVIQAAEQDVGLVLSGHTHGGQFWPWKYLVRIQQPYVSGLHRHGKRTQIYVSQGTGYWGPPMRLGTASEISLITLKSSHQRD